MIDIANLLLAFKLSEASVTIGGNRREYELHEQIIGEIAVVDVSDIPSEGSVSTIRTRATILDVLLCLQTFALVPVGSSIAATYLFICGRAVIRLRYTLP